MRDQSSGTDQREKERSSKKRREEKSAKRAIESSEISVGRQSRKYKEKKRQQEYLQKRGMRRSSTHHDDIRVQHWDRHKDESSSTHTERGTKTAKSANRFTEYNYMQAMADQESSKRKTTPKQHLSGPMNFNDYQLKMTKVKSDPDYVKSKPNFTSKSKKNSIKSPREYKFQNKPRANSRDKVIHVSPPVPKQSDPHLSVQ